MATEAQEPNQDYVENVSMYSFREFVQQIQISWNKEYASDQLQALMVDTARFNQRQLYRIVDWLKTKMEYPGMPRPRDIFQAAQDLGFMSPDLNHTRKFEGCDDCEGDGYVNAAVYQVDVDRFNTAKKIGAAGCPRSFCGVVLPRKWALFAFRCKCPKGASVYSGLPSFHDRYPKMDIRKASLDVANRVVRSGGQVSRPRPLSDSGKERFRQLCGVALPSEHTASGG